MRAPLLSVLMLTSITLSAQFDVNKMVQERMKQSQNGNSEPVEGMTVEDDNDPFIPNTFIGSFRLEIHNFEGMEEKKESPMNMHYWSNADMTLNQVDVKDMKGQDVKILTDLKNKWQYTLITDEEGKKTAMKSKKKKVTLKEQPASEQAVVTVTDETRMIDGYKCTKVVVKNEDGTWTGWVAEGMDDPFADMFRDMKPSKQSAQILRKYEGVQGFPIEYEWADVNGKDRIVCYTRELKTGSVDEAVFSLDGYDVMEMPAMGQ